MNLSVKLFIKDEVRRFVFTGTTVEELRQTCLRIANLQPSTTAVLQYKDNEDDLITFSTDSEFHYAVSTRNNENDVFRVYMQLLASNPMQPSYSQAQFSAPLSPAVMSTDFPPLSPQSPPLSPISPVSPGGSMDIDSSTSTSSLNDQQNSFEEIRKSAPYDYKKHIHNRSGHRHDRHDNRHDRHEQRQELKTEKHDYRLNKKFERQKVKQERIKEKRAQDWKERREKPFKLKELNARFVTHVNYEDGCQVPCGTPFVKTWRIRNDGSLRWPEGSCFMRLDKANELHAQNLTPVSPPLPETGVEVQISVPMTVPMMTGMYTTYFRMVTPDGKKFGQRMRCQIMAVPANYVPQPASYGHLQPTLPPQPFFSQSLPPQPLQSQIQPQPSPLQTYPLFQPYQQQQQHQQQHQQPQQPQQRLQSQSQPQLQPQSIAQSQPQNQTQTPPQSPLVVSLSPEQKNALQQQQLQLELQLQQMRVQQMQTPQALQGEQQQQQQQLQQLYFQIQQLQQLQQLLLQQQQQKPQ